MATLTLKLDDEQMGEIKAAIDRGVAEIMARIDPMPAAYLVELCGSSELVHTYSAAEITKGLLERELDDPDCATITPLFALAGKSAC